MWSHDAIQHSTAAGTCNIDVNLTVKALCRLLIAFGVPHCIHHLTIHGVSLGPCHVALGLTYHNTYWTS